MATLVFQFYLAISSHFNASMRSPSFLEFLHVGHVHAMLSEIKKNILKKGEEKTVFRFTVKTEMR